MIAPDMRNHVPSKTRTCISIPALILLLVANGLLYAGGGGSEALTKLLEGNRQFVSGKLNIDSSAERRKEIAKGQHPIATILACSDSRVPPEIIFNQGLGDIFVVRVAGNVVDDIALGSIEYGVEHLHTPLLIILGHSSCGAVKAAVTLKGEPHGNIGAILKKIMPAVKIANKRAKGKGEDAIVDAAIRENIDNSYHEILRRSRIVRVLSHRHELTIVRALYKLGSGAVVVLK
jgi:carbonic anhydrase